MVRENNPPGHPEPTFDFEVTDVENSVGRADLNAFGRQRAMPLQGVHFAVEIVDQIGRHTLNGKAAIAIRG
jgi:hypothetical protein